MSRLTAYSYTGGRDLYYGVPDLEGATVVAVTPSRDGEYFQTLVELQLKNGLKFELVIKQER